MDHVAMPQKGINWRRWLHGLGSLFALAGVVFVVLRFRVLWGQLDTTLWNSVFALKILALSLVYGASNFFLARAWRHILLHLGVKADHQATTRIYGLSQLAKYLPGNIFHLAGRQALGMSAGMPAGVLAKSTLWELGLIVVAGASFSALVLPVIWPAANAVMALLIWGVFVIAAALALWKLFGVHTRTAFFYYTFFLVLSALVFMLLLASLEGVGPKTIAFGPAVCGAYIVAWLIGLVTPGAPAGVGIRELVLLILLGNFIPDAALLSAVVVSRLVTVAGDIFFFIGAFFLPSTIEIQPL